MKESMKPLTRNEMRQVQGGKNPGFAPYMTVGVGYTNGCCAGLSACYTIPQNHDLYCVPPSQCNND